MEKRRRPLSEYDASELKDILGDASTGYMRIVASHMLWNLDITSSSKESLITMLQSEDSEMIALAYTLINDIYDKREKEGKIPNC